MLDTETHLADLERRRRSQGDGFTVQDEAEYERLTELVRARDLGAADSDLLGELQASIPVTRADLEHKRYEVALEDEAKGKPRTFLVEGDTIPQFVYPLGGRLTDSGLRDTWVSHAARILSARGVVLPNGWAGN
jgi:hypothetical protein